MLDKSRHSAISALLDERAEGHSLPAGLYTREDVYAADIDVFFRKHWIFIGPECDVPEPGDASVIDIAGSSLIMLRDDDGEVRVFHNVCRHRGARILDEGTSIVSRLVCPYHQWTYELTGELVHAPHMGRDFDKSCNGLKPVSFRNIGGLIHVCLSDDPPADIAELEAVGRERLLPYDLGNTRVAFQHDLIEHGNWKLTIENNRECYHCAANHPELCVSYIDLDFGFDPESLPPEDRERAARHEALYARQIAAWEAEGYPSAAIEHVSGTESNFRTQRLIISGAGESQTPDARAAVSRLTGIGRKDLGDTHLWGHNSWHHFMGDHIIVAAIIPLGPDRTLLRMKWLVHKDAVEGVDYDLHNLTSVWVATNEEDAALVGRSQAGVSDPAYVPGRYSPFTEKQLDWFAGWYVDRMRAHGY